MAVRDGETWLIESLLPYIKLSNYCSINSQYFLDSNWWRGKAEISDILRTWERKEVIKELKNLSSGFDSEKFQQSNSQTNQDTNQDLMTKYKKILIGMLKRSYIQKDLLTHQIGWENINIMPNFNQHGQQQTTTESQSVVTVVDAIFELLNLSSSDSESGSGSVDNNSNSFKLTEDDRSLLLQVLTNRDTDGWSLSHWAAHQGHQGVLDKIMDSNWNQICSDINCKTKGNDSPFCLAVQNRHMGVAWKLVSSYVNNLNSGSDSDVREIHDDSELQIQQQQFQPSQRDFHVLNRCIKIIESQSSTSQSSSWKRMMTSMVVRRLEDFNDRNSVLDMESCREEVSKLDFHYLNSCLTSAQCPGLGNQNAWIALLQRDSSNEMLDITDVKLKIGQGIIRSKNNSISNTTTSNKFTNLLTFAIHNHNKTMLDLLLARNDVKSNKNNIVTRLDKHRSNNTILHEAIMIESSVMIKALFSQLNDCRSLLDIRNKENLTPLEVARNLLSQEKKNYSLNQNSKRPIISLNHHNHNDLSQIEELLKTELILRRLANSTSPEECRQLMMLSAKVAAASSSSSCSSSSSGCSSSSTTGVVVRDASATGTGGNGDINDECNEKASGSGSGGSFIPLNSSNVKNHSNVPIKSETDDIAESGQQSKQIEIIDKSDDKQNLNRKLPFNLSSSSGKRCIESDADLTLATSQSKKPLYSSKSIIPETSDSNPIGQIKTGQYEAVKITSSSSSKGLNSNNTSCFDDTQAKIRQNETKNIVIAKSTQLDSDTNDIENIQAENNLEDSDSITLQNYSVAADHQVKKKKSSKGLDYFIDKNENQDVQLEIQDMIDNTESENSEDILLRNLLLKSPDNVNGHDISELENTTNEYTNEDGSESVSVSKVPVEDSNDRGKKKKHSANLQLNESPQIENAESNDDTTGNAARTDDQVYINDNICPVQVNRLNPTTNSNSLQSYPNLFPITDPNSPPLCDICCDRPKDRALACGHILCATCVLESLKNSGECPNCKQVVDVREVRRIYM